MWTISMLKGNAKQALKRFYWTAVLVTLIATILGAGGGNSAGSSAANNDSLNSYIEDYIEDSDYYDDDSYDQDYNYVFDDNPDNDYSSLFTPALFFTVLGVIVVILMLLAAVISVFLSMPVAVGQNLFYMRARSADARVGDLFGQFSRGRYLATVKAMFLMRLKIFLWSLLLVVPGIIKTYEYALVPYILAENPNIPTERAFEISRRTMDGEKMNFFVLECSFIGWFILGGITIIGNLFVMPYYNATMCEFYCCMRQKALSTGIASPYELTGEFSGTTVIGGNAGYNGGYNGGYNYNGQAFPTGMPTQNNYGGTNPAPQQGYRPTNPYQNSGSATMDEISFDDRPKIDLNKDNKDDYQGPEIK